MNVNPNKHEGDVRQFRVLSESWYANSSLSAEERNRGDDRIVMGFYCPDGGTTGEFHIKWTPLDGRQVPQLCAFDDAWSALMNFSDVLQGLAKLDSTTPTVKQVVQVLLDCGIIDATERVSPYSRLRQSA